MYSRVEYFGLQKDAKIYFRQKTPFNTRQTKGRLVSKSLHNPIV